MRRSVDFKKTVLFVVVTIFLVFVSAFCISGTVMSKCDLEYAELENYYREQEEDLLHRTKAQLEEMGYRNSGVTLTRVVDESGNREYTFTIHHGKIDKMSEEERAALAEVLQAGENCGFLADCSFYHEFLMYE